jgi:hypothetical protein
MIGHQTTDATPETIRSTSFGAFAPPASMPLVTTDREFVAMATGVVRGQWEVPPEAFTELPAKLFEIAMGGTRTAIKAARLLVEMHAANGAGEINIDHRGDVVVYIPDNGRGPKGVPNE